MSEYKVTLDENEHGDNTTLTIRHGYQTVIYYDGGEPEDNSFYRDYSWIAPELELAYKLGFQDGWKAGRDTDDEEKTAE